MEAAATLTLSSTLQLHPPRLFTCTGPHKPTITTINLRNRTMTFHQPTLFPQYGRLQLKCGHKSRHMVHAMGDGPELMNGDHEEDKMCARATSGSTLEALMNMADPTKQAQIRLDKPIQSNLLVDLQEKTEKGTRIDVADLKEASRTLALCEDKIDEAVGKLRKAYKYLKEVPKVHEAYDFGLVLVEMLIYQGNYHEAKKLVEELDPHSSNDKNSSEALIADAKLYKAIIHLMLRDEEEQNARRSFEDYNKSSINPTEEGKQVDTVLPSNADHKLYEPIFHLMLGDVEDQNARQNWKDYITSSINSTEGGKQVDTILTSNADPKLYKAIIHLILRDVEEQNAHQTWQEYVKSFLVPIVEGKSVTFQQFKERMKKLRQRTERNP